MTAVALLAPHLTSENYSEVLNAARHKSKRDVEQLVARLRPHPPAPSTIRKLPVSKAPLSANFQLPVPASSMTARVAELPIAPPGVRPKPTAVKPLASDQFTVQFTMSRETYERLRRVQDLVRHTIPDADPAKIFDRALSLLLAHLERSKLAATGRPRTSGRAARSDARYIPAAMKREVWRRDGGRCKFVGTDGRCGETGFLEFHHVVPFAAGGKTTADNLELRCRAQNAYEAELHFGLRQPLLIRESAIGFS